MISNPTNSDRLAASLVERERRIALGIVEADWLYSGAPCMVDPRHPTPEDERQNADHAAANGKRYSLRDGFLIGERLVHPGEEPGCKCISVVVAPWADD
jgi:hypothetical protein